MLKIRMLLLIGVIFFAGCSEQQQPPIKLVANSWIGFTPLFYAKEKGWLAESHFELSTVVSLGESMMTFKSGHFDGITGTQYEYQKLLEKGEKMVPIIMFDRSNGGDMVMGNRSLEEMRATDQPIDVYLEIDSINYVVFKDFIKAKKMGDKKFNFINQDPLKVVTTIKKNNITNPSLVTTYIPYNFELEQHKFTTLASTRDIEDIMVLDALYVTRSSLDGNRNSYLKLKSYINQALADLQKNPKEYYNLVKPYLENASYEEFTASLADIEWITQPIPEPILLKMRQMEFASKDLM